MKPIFPNVGLLAAMVLGLMLAGCTTVAEIRTHHGIGGDLPVVDSDNPSKDCYSPSVTAETRSYSIEDYGPFWAGFVEFDDEGWLYTTRDQPNQMQIIGARLKQELNDARYVDTDFLVVAFVHGWHHNANDTDCNVHEFRAMLKVANDRYRAALALDPKMHPRRIVGIYAGWRGESVAVDHLNVTSVLDRRNAAERVAKGDVREVFAQLRKLQIGESQKPGMRDDRMRTVVVGHSFGGLIAFHGLSPAALNELTLTKPEENCVPTVYRSPKVLLQHGVLSARAEPEASGEKSKTPPVFPDMLILINPAFEATRFNSLHELMRPVEGCRYPEDRPKVVVVTADNDSATGAIFHAGREVLTFLEAYPRESDPSEVSRERDANTHAIGFTDRYKTHRLCLVPGADGKTRAVAALTPPLDPEWPPDPFAPVWVVGAPPEIVDNHNGFFFAKRDPAKDRQEPYLLDWLVSLHLFGPGPGSPAMTAERGCD